MHLSDKQPEALNQISALLKDLTDQLFAALPATTPITISPCDDIFDALTQTSHCNQHSLIYLQEGELHCKQDDKSVYFAEPGDLLGLHRSLDLPCTSVSNDAPATVKIYQYEQIQEALSSNRALLDIWSQYLICNASFFRLALTEEIRHNFHPPSGFLHFGEGDTIIEQGGTAECVYTLLEGSANAFRDDIKVGEILPEQIFGALAVFTRQSRTATVIASTNCTVLAVRKEDFLDLIQHQPHVCLSLIEEMADRIDQLNQKVVKSATSNN